MFATSSRVALPNLQLKNRSGPLCVIIRGLAVDWIETSLSAATKARGPAAVTKGSFRDAWRTSSRRLARAGVSGIKGIIFYVWIKLLGGRYRTALSRRTCDDLPVPQRERESARGFSRFPKPPKRPIVPPCPPWRGKRAGGWIFIYPDRLSRDYLFSSNRNSTKLSLGIHPISSPLRHRDIPFDPLPIFKSR